MANPCDDPELSAAHQAMRACFSPCRTYRYALWRRWEPGGCVLLVGLNPSTACETHDDPTIRRCIAFARSWGYGALCVANLFALRSRHPALLRRVADPVGPQNDAFLQQLAQRAELVVAAWGTQGTYLHRDAAVRRMLPQLHCLRLTRAGHPSHPLYLPAHLQPVRWPQEASAARSRP
ncbi:MAG: DUF1643 domain-containing protein [Prochlorococcaceae cyanobacterium]|jgi:hypothetical protein